MFPSRRAAAAIATLLALAAALIVQPAAARAERVVLSAGHVDAVAPTLDGDQLRFMVKDGTGAAPVLRQPDDVLFHVKPQARMTVPAGLPPAFAFLGEPGSEIWLLPQVQDPELLWAGWSSETIPAGRYEGDRLEWRLDEVEGPGAVQLFDSGPFGAPRVFFDSADGLPDSEQRPVGTHAHFNWVFHEPGVYTLNFSIAVRRTDSTDQVMFAKYRFFVGDLADQPPEEVYIEGLAQAYDPGATVALSATQRPASRFTDVRWYRTCPGESEPRRVAAGATYTFTAEREHDSCRLAASLHDDAGRELLRSHEALLNLRSGTWGPRTILSRGHVDVLHVTLADGALHVALKDDSVEPATIRRPEEVLLHAKPQAAFTLPANLPAEYGFLGRAGDSVFLLPEVEQDDILWPGWDTNGVPRGALAGDLMTWRLLSADGPGSLQLFTTDPAALPSVIFNSADGLPDTSVMPTGTHVHANWTFSRAGLYKLRFELSNGQLTTGPVEYWFYAGDLADLPPYPEADEEVPAPAPPNATPAPPAPPAPRVTAPKRPSLRLTAASLRGRTLTLRTRFGTRSRVTIDVRRGGRTLARAKPRIVSPSRRVLRVRLSRRLAPGRYRVRVVAETEGGRVTRTIALRVR